MSMELMVKAMNIRVGNSNRKLVLIKLADNANDLGECWPSYQHIADACEMSKSTVKAHVRELEKAGLVYREFRRDGKLNKSNLFHLSLDKAMQSSGADSDPVGQILPEGGASAALGGGANSAPRTSHSFESVNEPEDIAPHGECAPEPVIVDQPAEPKPAPKKTAAKKTELDYSGWPTMPDPQILADWIKSRKAQRAAVTQTAINRLASELHKAAEAGYTVDDCLGLACLRGWRGIKAEWVINANSSNQNPGAHHAVSRPNTQQQQRAEVDAAINNWQDTSWAADLINGDDPGFI